MSEKDEGLKACPHCQKAMQYRAALWPSDGCTDAIIHAEPTDCGLVQFDIGATDGGVSTIAAWNRRPDVSELVEALRAFTEIMEHCSVTDGVCCCGDDMEKHASPMNCGHSPVDHGQYHANQMYEKARALIAKHSPVQEDRT